MKTLLYGLLLGLAYMELDGSGHIRVALQRLCWFLPRIANTKPVWFLSSSHTSTTLNAQSLRCYTCKEPTDIAKCKTVTLCPPKSIVCTTTLHSVDSGYPFFGNITVTRNCEEECVSYDGIGANKPKSCCYTDLCTDDNRSSSGVGRSSAALGLMAMVVGTVLQCAL